MIRLIITIFWIQLSVISISQCKVTKLPFKNGEQLDYVVYYNYKKLWVPAAKVRFNVEDSLYNGDQCWHFNGRGKTYKEYDWMFKVRDQYQSFANKIDLKPKQFFRDVHEGSNSIYYDYIYDFKKHEARYKKSKSSIKYDNIIEISDCTFDLMTAIYYARSIDFSNLRVNDTIPLYMVIDGELFETRLRFTGKGIAKDNKDTKYNVIKFKPLLMEGTIFKGGEDMEVSVTDDQNHIPIFVEAKILVGSVKVYLNSTKGIKHPIISKIK